MLSGCPFKYFSPRIICLASVCRHCLSCLSLETNGEEGEEGCSSSIPLSLVLGLVLDLQCKPRVYQLWSWRSAAMLATLEVSEKWNPMQTKISLWLPNLTRIEAWSALTLQSQSSRYLQKGLIFLISPSCPASATMLQHKVLPTSRYYYGGMMFSK